PAPSLSTHILSLPDALPICHTGFSSNSLDIDLNTKVGSPGYQLCFRFSSQDIQGFIQCCWTTKATDFPACGISCGDICCHRLRSRLTAASCKRVVSLGLA